MKSPKREDAKRGSQLRDALMWMPVAMLLLVIPATAQTDAILRPIGGGGGSQFVARCPQSELLTGVDLRAGEQVDSIQPICVPGVAGQFQTYPLRFGGNGGSPLVLVCPNDAPIVTGMDIRWGNHLIVMSIHLFCGVAAAAQAPTEVPAAVFDGTSTITGGGGRQRCPAGLVGVGINGRSGERLDALGLICGAPPVILPPIVVATEPPGVKPQGRVKLPGGADKPSISICEAAKLALQRSSPATPGLQAQCSAQLSELHARGAAIANADPLAAELRNQQPDAPALRGFDIGMAAAEGNTAPGPGKQAIHDALSPAEQGGFDAAVAYSLARNKYADLAATGATIAAADPIVAAARNGQADVLYRLGFDIATGLFGDPALGAKGNTQTGTGSFAIRNSLTAAARRGFNVSVALHLSRDYLLPAKAGEPPVVVSGSCGPPGGTATIVIPDPKLKRLNVRASAGGTVLGTIPEGSQVSIVGVCGAEPAAGLVKPQQPKATGWCQIDAPVLGCVSAKFLDFGGTGAAGVAAGIAKPPATEAEVPAAAAPDFAGEWSSVVDGVAHYITLSQKGGTVKGTYQADDGSSGKIAGKASGNLLRFAWSQADGIAGSGKFILSGDGQSFEGSYNFGDNPDQVEGSWNGSR